MSVHRQKPPLKPFVQSAQDRPDTLSHSPVVVRFQKDSHPVGWFAGQTKKPDCGLSVDFALRRHLHGFEAAPQRLHHERKNLPEPVREASSLSSVAEVIIQIVESSRHEDVLRHVWLPALVAWRGAQS